MNKSAADLADPQWELIDPTPNIHALFVQFNAKFFWGSLESVSVRWSKRMYSCAGICRYEGRGGLCDIGLSEPLLKLRPRKDLIETLLHEMIHAYLFVAEQDRDRDGHGPNFQRHMHRINQAAKLNISIYHTFHDEVRLYQTHWWCCNGPCRNQKPFFGTVRRSSNRAPGPNDFWWNQHQATCGGQFIKVKEPEKTKKAAASKPKENITKYIKPTSNVSNIITLTDIPATSNTSCPTLNGIKKNKKPNTLTSPVNNAKRNTLVDSWAGKGNNLKTSTPTRGPSVDVRATVRNHWQDKELVISAPNLPNTSAKNTKRPASATATEIISPAAKIKKIDSYFPTTRSPPENFSKKDAESLLKDIYGENITLNNRKYDNMFSPPKTLPIVNSNGTDNLDDIVDCPCCNKAVNSSEINEHLDVCSKTVENTIDLNSSQSEDVKVSNFNNSSNTTDNSFSTTILNASDLVDCPSCGKKISSFDINEHLDACLLKKCKAEVVDLTTVSQCCPICNSIVPGSLEEHFESCLQELDRNPRNRPSTSTKNLVNSIFLVDDDDEDDFNDSATFNTTGTMHPCPCCMKMVEENLMTRHIQECLATLSEFKI